MANFSTEFPIDPKNSVADVIALACDWLTGSPHTKVPEEALRDIPENSDLVQTFGTETVTLAHSRSEGAELGGLRYERTEDGLAWTTSIVTLKTSDRHLLSLQVICEALTTAVRLPPPKKPYFIRQALSELGGGADGEIPVTDQPIRLSTGEESVAAALILGTAQNALPIVYVSAGFGNSYLVNPTELAKFVSGMAHVIVEPNRSFSLRLRNLVKSRNAFGGTIGVYWPGSDARRTYFPSEIKPKPRALEIEIAKDIRIALSNRRQRSTCTWAHLTETLARGRYEQLKRAGSTELQAYIDAFDADMAAKQARVNEAEAQIASLEADIRRLSSIKENADAGLIRQGEEQDLYEHEIRDLILDALNDALRAARQDSRRSHVLADLIAANPKSGAREKLEEEIKTILKTYRDMDAKTRSSLARLGFDLSEDGKHYKAVFEGDPRYMFTLPTTSSDSRAGKNMASDINNKLF